MTRLTRTPPPLDRLTAALATALVTLTLATALALPAAVHAQTQGQSACPDGVTQTGVLLTVSGIQADRVTLWGRGLPINSHDIQSLSEVTVDRRSGWYSATLYTGVRGYGYADSARDARSFGNNQIRVQDGDLIHGAWFHAIRVAADDVYLPNPHSTVLGLLPSKKYVAQLVVGELRDRHGEDVTNQFVSGTANSINGNKPKPVLAQICFQTAAAAP